MHAHLRECVLLEHDVHDDHDDDEYGTADERCDVDNGLSPNERTVAPSSTAGIT